MKELTKAEELLMQCLWKLEKAFLKDIVEEYPEPKPAYTTVSTVVNVLVKKGIVGFDQYGKVKQYYPLVSRKEYSRASFKGLMHRFFNDSPSQFASFFAKDNSLSVNELEEIQSMIQSEIDKQKNE